MEEKTQVVERETKKDEVHEKDARNKRYAMHTLFLQKITNLLSMRLSKLYYTLFPHLNLYFFDGYPVDSEYVYSIIIDEWWIFQTYRRIEIWLT